jgi:hypothetical protein
LQQGERWSKISNEGGNTNVQDQLGHPDKDAELKNFNADQSG